MIRSITSYFIVVAVSFGFWHYNPSANEQEYWIFEPSGHHLSYPCGFVSVNHVAQPGIAAGQGFVADIVRPSNDAEIGSKWYNDMDGAKAFVETTCGGIR